MGFDMNPLLILKPACLPQELFCTHDLIFFFFFLAASGLNCVGFSLVWACGFSLL